MTTETAPASSLPQPEDLPPRKSLEQMIAEQGVAETATFQHLFGSGQNLWSDDTEFDAFLHHLDAIRHEKS